MHPPVGIAPGHFLMEDSASRRHPLNITRTQLALVSQTIPVVDLPREDVRDGLDAPMRMPRKTCKVIGRIFIPEIIEQQERIELFRLPEAERSA